MARSKFLINNYMKDFKYYGLFLTDGGKPVDSNSITKWKDIEPILVETKLEKR